MHDLRYVAIEKIIYVPSPIIRVAGSIALVSTAKQG